MGSVGTVIAVVLCLLILASPVLLYFALKELKALREQAQRDSTVIAKLSRDLEQTLIEADQAQRASDIANSKLELAGENANAEVVGLRNAVQAITNQFVNDCTRYICAGVTANNFEASRNKVEKIFALVRSHNIDFPKKDEADFYRKVETEWKVEVKRDLAKQEQQRIKERIRDEARAEKEREDELKRLEREQQSISAALQKALRDVNNEHSAEVERLRAQLAEAEAKSERAKSQAQLTRAGYVYVISNVGSFGDRIFKIGMTRRLEPMDRVKELGDASVPFSFDVHMMISCEDAPTLETNLHRDLHSFRQNKVNFRKEFFEVDLDQIAQAVERHHGKIEYTIKSEALEYRETLLIKERGTESQYDPSLQEVEEDAKQSAA